MPRNMIRTLISSRVGRHWGFPSVPAQPGGSSPAGDPILPRQAVAMGAPLVTGTIWDCPDSASFATALSGAASGDRINLHAGVTYIPSTIDGFRVPAKAGPGWLTITLRDSDLALLPALNADGTCAVASANARVGHTHWAAGLMATIQTYHGSGGTQRGIGLRLAPGVQRCYLRGVAVVVDPAFAGTNDLPHLQLGTFGAIGADVVSSQADIPTDIIAQQVYVMNPIASTVKRAVDFHCDRGAFANSTIIARGVNHNEVQGLWLANCNGPQRHYNSAYIAPGINWFSGGVDLSPSYMAGRLPSDITCEFCWFYKPPEWIRGHPAYLGTFQNCKNSQELKMGKYVLIDRCIWEGASHNNATMGQNGQTLTVKVLTEAFFSNPKASAGVPGDATHGGQMYWTEVGHVTVRRSHSFAAGSGFDVLGVQDTIYSGLAVPTNNVLIEDCLVEIVTDGSYTGVKRTFNLSGASAFSGRGHDWMFRHCTTLGPSIHVFSQSLVDNLMVEHCLRQYGNNNYVGGVGAWWGTLSGASQANATVITTYCPGTHHNAWIGDFASRYPGYATTNGGTNWMDGTDASFGLNADGSLAPGSLLIGAGSDGQSIGSRVNVLSLTAGVRQPGQLPAWP